MRLERVYSIIAYGCFFMVTGDRDCALSRQTVEQVDSCPMNKTALEKRMREKNCEAYSKLQTCVDPSKFLYHCVINEYGNATVDVCAPVYIINGFCAEYNTVGARIQPHYNLRCSEISPPCADRYNSTDAYLYAGCYSLVKRKPSTTFDTNHQTYTTEISSTLGEIPATQDTGFELIIGIVVLIVFIAVFVVSFVIYVQKIRRRKKKESHVSSFNDQEQLLLIDPRNEKCDRADYEQTIARGRLLRDRVLKEEKIMDAKMKEIEDNTAGFLKAYEKVNLYFVKTRFFQESKNKLKMFGIAVLIGQQGSGKTSTAVHIMNDPEYKTWIKRKITSWEDLLALSGVTNDTLIYIDNLFDGFLYRQKLDEWWDSLCYFYFECVQPRENIRVLITAKTDVIKTTCSFLCANEITLEQTFFIREELFSLMNEEKTEILKRQIQQANELKGIKICFMREELKSEIKRKTCPIGFPLCAHMYAFEEDQTLRDASIFDNPRSYVRKQIHNEIQNDANHDIKTLLLILLFHCSQNESKSSNTLNLQYGTDCKEYLKEKTSEDFIRKMNGLKFGALFEKAKGLEDKILIKNQKRFEFKHQIYLEEVCDYFFRMYFDVVVECFPLDILRNCKMHDVSPDKFEKLLQRLKREITSKAISETLNWKIFEDLEFEQSFCNDIEKDCAFMDLLLYSSDKSSGYAFPVIFWASKFNYSKLSKLIVEYAAKNEKEERLQFYLARFGECCAVIENYITRATNPPKVENLQKCVFNFETPQGDSILHLLLSSNMSDYDAHYAVKKLLMEPKKYDLKMDKSLLISTLQQTKCSRLLCILEVLNRLRDLSVEDKNQIAPLMNKSKWKSSSKTTLSELECLCRICIFLVYGVIPFTESFDEIFFNQSDAIHETCVNDKVQKRMAIRIVECLQTMDASSLDDNVKIQFKIKVNLKLVTALKTSIQILSKQENITK